MTVYDLFLQSKNVFWTVGRESMATTQLSYPNSYKHMWSLNILFFSSLRYGSLAVYPHNRGLPNVLRDAEK